MSYPPKSKNNITTYKAFSFRPSTANTVMASAPLYVAFGAVKDAVSRDEESGLTVQALNFIQREDRVTQLTTATQVCSSNTAAPTSCVPPGNFDAGKTDHVILDALGCALNA